MDCDSTKLSSSAKSTKNKQLGAQNLYNWFFISFSLLLSFPFFSKWVTFGFGTSGFSVSRTWNILIFPTWNVLIFPNFKAPTSSALLKSIELQSWNRLREKLTHWTLGSSYLPLTIWSQTVNSWSGIISHLKKTLKLMV